MQQSNCNFESPCRTKEVKLLLVVLILTCRTSQDLSGFFVFLRTSHGITGLFLPQELELLAKAICVFLSSSNWMNILMDLLLFGWLFKLHYLKFIHKKKSDPQKTPFKNPEVSLTEIIFCSSFCSSPASQKTGDFSEKSTAVYQSPVSTFQCFKQLIQHKNSDLSTKCL